MRDPVPQAADRGLEASRTQAAGQPPVPAERLRPCPLPQPRRLPLFQRGMEALQRHAYADAATAFQAVLMGFPQRTGAAGARQGLSGALRARISRRPPAPKTIEERLTAATAALNNGDDRSCRGAGEERAGRRPQARPRAVPARRGLRAHGDRRRKPSTSWARCIAISPRPPPRPGPTTTSTSLHDEDAFWTLTEPPIVPAGPRRRRRARG